MKEAAALPFADFVKFRPTAIPGGPPSAFSAPNGLGLKYRPVAYETISTVNTLGAKVLQSDPGQERVRARIAALGRTKCWLPKHKLH
ncbi:conserved hypothetical protein; Cyoups 2 protein [Pseudomonas entomophila L48]|uniref:Uncharacterized protein n=1 Tax=Pseudomonas entomophila (strain L48) TaxID=384676 RepID=Q1IEP5_PSEE4|nr:conserved hypothetical protein; Cyoups 2 protein [Pseudomonas entomophila L48]